MPFWRALRELSTRDSYVLYQLPPSRWRHLAHRSGGDKNGNENEKVLRIPRHLPDVGKERSWLDEAWPERCLGGALALEWSLKTHWAQLAVGARSTGMANHTDALLTGSWHAQLAGSKSWRLCPPSGDGRGGSDDDSSACFEGVLSAGEVLVYGAAWSHATRALETPTISASRAVVQQSLADAFVEQILHDCASTGKSGTDLHLSGALCDAFDTECAPLIRQSAADASAASSTPATSGVSWRDLAREQGAARAAASGGTSTGEMAARRAIAKREAVRPEHYTYEALSLQMNRDYYELRGLTILDDLIDEPSPPVVDEPQNMPQNRERRAMVDGTRIVERDGLADEL